ncbi:DUF2975 domain-containing protein [Nocardiopsis salina]|uniref:DUF2975 domain-containing protein n=1 Tax=Nocardiopsis salina TaxID=245836 RepID=UPI000344CD91|nr:DUF2975 domain-containing protein [Nocardiopsis salina]
MASRIRIRWTRTDSDIMGAVLLAVAVLGSLSLLVTLAWALFAVPSVLTGWMNKVSVHHTSEVAVAAPEMTVLADGVGVQGTDEAVLVFQDPGLGQRLLLAVPVLLWHALVLSVALTVRNVLLSLREGDPFVPVNVRRVYTLAVLAFLGSLLLPMIGVVCDLALRHGVVELGQAALFGFSLNPTSGPLAGLLASLVLAALAEVFRRGSRMRDDVDGLV